MMETVKGIDLSKWNGSVDFDAVKEAGYAFVIIKSSEGVGYTDPKFYANWTAAQEAGLIVGAYHFARVSKAEDKTIEEDAIDEAEWFWSRIKKMGGMQDQVIPPVLDIEWDKRAKAAGITAVETIRWCLVFLDRIERLSGVRPVVYTGKNFWRYKLRKSPEFFEYPLWLVQYSKRGLRFGSGKAGEPGAPIPGWSWKIWQWSGGGKVAYGPKIDGVGRPDYNWWHGSAEELEEFSANAPLPSKVETLPPVPGVSILVPAKEPERKPVPKADPEVVAAAMEKIPSEPRMEIDGIIGRVVGWFVVWISELFENKRADTSGKGVVA